MGQVNPRLTKRCGTVAKIGKCRGINSIIDLENDYGLSVRHLTLIYNIWSKIQPNMNSYGNELLIRYFASYPENKQYFSFFKGTHAHTELKDNPLVKSHGVVIMKWISKLIHACASKDPVNRMLRNIYFSHLQRAIPYESYMQLKTCFLKMIKEYPGTTTDDIEAWDIGLTLLHNCVSGYDYSKLTQEDRGHMKLSQKIINMDPVSNALIIWQNFFNERSGNRKYFSFEGIENAENLRKDHKFSSFSRQFMGKLNLMLTNLDNEEKLNELVIMHKETHAKRHINKAAYEDLKAAFLTGLDMMLGSQCTPDTKLAFDKALNTLFLKFLEK